MFSSHVVFKNHIIENIQKTVDTQQVESSDFIFYYQLLRIILKLTIN